MKHNNVNDFAASLTLSFSREAAGRVGHLLWAHGILFRHVPFIQTDRMTNEYVEGHLPIDNIEFTSMDNFCNEIRHGQFIITVMDVSNNFVLSRLAEWISQNLIINDNHSTKRTIKKRH
jgi:hypothetical protein